MIRAALAALLATALVTPAMAGSYPLSGRWGVSASAQKGPIDCSGLRVISFNIYIISDRKKSAQKRRHICVTDVCLPNN